MSDLPPRCENTPPPSKSRRRCFPPWPVVLHQQRFEEEVEVLRTKYDEVDKNALVTKLLQEEVAFTTVEAEDLATLKLRPRDEGRVYLLGESNFMQPLPSDVLVVQKLTPKALGIVGDEKLAVVAREALPTNARTKKKAVELMGSTKVVTEKKALKRLGSEMTQGMRVLQMKNDKKELKIQVHREEREREASMHSVAGSNSGEAEGGAVGSLVPTNSMSNMRLSSPSFADTSMGRRATRLMADGPKFRASGSATDVAPR